MMNSPATVSWTHLAGGDKRTATILVPSGTIRAVWICFHGAGGTGVWTLEESALDAVAQDTGALLIFPEGRRQDPSKPAGFLNNPQVWDDDSGRFDEFLSPGDDLEYVASLLERIGVHAPRLPLHFLGFSNGAAFAHRVVREYPEKAASLALLCGIPFPKRGEKSFTPFEPVVPLLTIHGGKDPLIPWDGGDTSSPWTRKREMRPALAPLFEQWIASLGGVVTDEDAIHEGLRRRFRRLKADQAWMESYLVNDMGHHWPGGLGRINWRLAGPPSWRLDGNALLRAFFERAETKPRDFAAFVEQTDPKRIQAMPKRHPSVVHS